MTGGQQGNTSGPVHPRVMSAPVHHRIYTFCTQSNATHCLQPTPSFITFSLPMRVHGYVWVICVCVLLCVLCFCYNTYYQFPFLQVPKNSPNFNHSSTSHYKICNPGSLAFIESLAAFTNTLWQRHSPILCGIISISLVLNIE